MLLAILPMLYFSSPWLIYFITGSWYPLILFIYFTHPPHPPSLWQPTICSLHLRVHAHIFCMSLYIILYVIDLNRFIQPLPHQVPELFCHHKGATLCSHNLLLFSTHLPISTVLSLQKCINRIIQ